MSQAIATTPLPPAWPQHGLESLGACPLCDSPERIILHQHLRDNVFFVAPGEWTLWQCGHCRAAYLDPRPTAETIGLAYSRYYTHEEDAPVSVPTRLQNLRSALGNGYRNWRYGTRLQPSSRLGIWAVWLFAPFRLSIDLSFRFLPKRPPQTGGRVLDIGSGSGVWLINARLAGWEAIGADPDPIAVERGREAGLDIRQGGVEAWADQPASLHFAALSHVIEHVHHPLQTLQAVFRLLKPGGQMFIETPNIEALGHRIYGANWRGLEAPRHLVIFNRESLVATLRAAGFVRIRFRRRRQPLTYLSIASARMAAGLDPYDEEARMKGVSLWRQIRSVLSFRRKEFLTLTCEKPE